MQTGGFLNRYDFAYTGRDVVNQTGKVGPGIIKGALNKPDSVAKHRIDQTISQGKKKIVSIAWSLYSYKGLLQTKFVGLKRGWKRPAHLYLRKCILQLLKVEERWGGAYRRIKCRESAFPCTCCENV